MEQWHIIALLLLQITNITVSALTPIISNFMQSITNSECCGLRIKRNITQSLKRVPTLSGPPALAGRSIRTDLADHKEDQTNYVEEIGKNNINLSV